MIPKNIHFIFGLDKDFCNKPLAEFHYLNLLSARRHNPDYRIVIHHYYTPACKVWKRISQEFETLHIPSLNDSICGKRVSNKEHIGDYLRLHLLEQYGGIYLDIDVVCLKSFDDLLNNQFVMGIEKSNARVEGLCNAVMLSQPNAPFANAWIDDYAINYQPEHWQVNSVVRPFELSKLYPQFITVLPHTAFFKFSWDDIDRPKIFEESNDVSDAYCLHLWETKNYNLLKLYNNDYVDSRNDTLSRIYKNIADISTSDVFV